MEKFLTNLGLEAVNPGAWAAGAGWLVDASSPRIEASRSSIGWTIGQSYPSALAAAAICSVHPGLPVAIISGDSAAM